VIQAAMGWLDYHLWEFTANERKYGMRLPDELIGMSESRMRRQLNCQGF
jgi:hypothetical protein